MQENFDINKAIKETSTFIRDKADATMYSATRKTSEASAKIIMKVVSAVIIFLIFILANVSLGLFIGQWFSIGYILGILSVAAFYTLLLIIVLLFFPCIVRSIANIISKKFVHKILEINKKLDDITPEQLKRDVEPISTIDTKKKQKKVVELEKEALQRLEKSQKTFKYNFAYIKENFKSIAVDIAKGKVIVALSKNKYASMIMGLLGVDTSENSSKRLPSQSYNNGKARTSKQSSNTKHWLSVATAVGTSLFWSFALSKTKKLLLGGLLPSISSFGKKKKKKKSLLSKIKSIF